MTSNDGNDASLTAARCLRTGNGDDTIVTRATMPPRRRQRWQRCHKGHNATAATAKTAKMPAHRWQRCMRIDGDDTSSTMSKEGNKETAGKTTTRITSGSTWAWNTSRQGSVGRNRGGTYTPGTVQGSSGDRREGLVPPDRRREAPCVPAVLLPQDARGSTPWTGLPSASQIGTPLTAPS